MQKNRFSEGNQSLIAREESWLSFNARVLQEAANTHTPLKSRIRFLGIFSNNRDEFFRRRMPALKQLVHVNSPKKRALFRRSLEQIYKVVLRQQIDFDTIWKKVKNDLKKEKITLIDDQNLNAEQKKFVTEYFDQEIRSSIIPLFIKDMAKWPSYGDENIFLGIAMKKNAKSSTHKFAIIEIPTHNNPRFIFLPSAPGKQTIMLLEDIIRYNLPKIFSYLGYTYFEAHMFKVTKDAEIEIDDDLSTTLIQKIEKGLKDRRHNHPVSFQYDKEMNKNLLKILIHKLNLSRDSIIIPGGKIRNFRDFMDFPAVFSDDQPKRLPFKHPALEKTQREFDLIMKKDILLHLPYHSFNSIIDLLCEAAMDSDVKSIKITAYRLAKNSKICNALINAARAGKQVNVVLELRAGFDEKANLEWKRKLEEEGVKVFLGLPHMKVHSKLCLIKRKQGNKFVSYGLIGTGNLNEKTALNYTDLFLLTSRSDITSDLHHIFKALENPEKNWSQLARCKTLLVSPTNMRSSIVDKIDREIRWAKSGKSSRIVLNLNSISDKKLLALLADAARAGVKIEMIIRGTFCAETHRKDYKKPISAISIVDEYLEHSRIWLFHNGGNEEIYISSADWNERNLDHRVETAAPIKDEAMKAEIKHILEIKLKDNVKARKLDEEFSNQYISAKGKKQIRSQVAIHHYLKHKGDG